MSKENEINIDVDGGVHQRPDGAACRGRMAVSGKCLQCGLELLSKSFVAGLEVKTPEMALKPDVCNQCGLNPNDALATDCEVFTVNGHCKNCDSHWTATERADLERERVAANEGEVWVWKEDDSIVLETKPVGGERHRIKMPRAMALGIAESLIHEARKGCV